MSFNIAIDGPAGAGKSTIARQVAEKLGFIYIDTGAMYRTLAYYFLQQGLDLQDEGAITASLGKVKVDLAYVEGEQHLILNGEDVTPYIRTEEVGKAASVTSVYPGVRAKLLDLQRSLAARMDVVMDGRDIGTCILPDADVKVFLTASERVRAQRRYQELVKKGIACDIDVIEKDIRDRDYRDMNREVAPLKQAEDGILVDGSHLTIGEVTDKILSLYKDKADRRL